VLDELARIPHQTLEGARAGPEREVLVDGLSDPKWLGRSFHLAPLSSTQKMPRRACRLSIAGRPPLELTDASDTRSASQSNCSSISRIAMQRYSRHEPNRLRGLRIGSRVSVKLCTLEKSLSRGTLCALQRRSPKGEVSSVARLTRRQKPEVPL
jgi:hypothetical protein